MTLLLSFALGVIFLLLSRLYFSVDGEPWKTLFGLLGAYLTISVIVNILHRNFLKPSEDQSRLEELEELLDQRIDHMLGQSSLHGFAGFVAEMDFKGLFKKLDANDTLWWLDTYCPGYQLWQDELETAIKRGANINMLVLDPSSRYAVDRANELGDSYKPQRFKDELRAFIEALEIIQDNNQNAPGALEIVKYNERLGLPIYIIERHGKLHEAYNSFYLTRPTGVGFPHLKWHPSASGLIRDFKAYVQLKWDNNSTSKRDN